MNGRVLLDTNIVIALFAEDSEVIAHLAAASEVFIPCIVLGELYFGALKSKHASANLARIHRLAINSAILDCNAITAHEYGQIKQSLKQKGHPIPENDLWIAALAKQHQLRLITRDSHFASIDNLSLAVW